MLMDGTIDSGAGEMKFQIPLLKRLLSFKSQGNIKDSLRWAINELFYDNKLKTAWYKKNLGIQVLFKKPGYSMEYISKCKFILDKYFNLHEFFW